MISGVVSVDGKYIQSDDGLHTFWTEKSFDEIFEEFSKPGKEFALVRVHDVRYNHAGGELASVLGFIN